MSTRVYSLLPVAAVLAGVALVAASAQESPRAGRAPAAPLERTVDVWSVHALPEEEAARQGRAALPFTPGQIEALGRILRETQAATARGHGEPPQGRVRRIRLDDGAIPRIELRRGYVTAVSFTDSTGAPWPIEEALVDRRFLPPGAESGAGDEGSEGGHLLYLAPQAAYLGGNAVVKLRGLAEPVVAGLRGTGAHADFRVEIRLGVPGPNADPGALAQPAAFHAGDAVLLGLLGGAVPPDAERLAVEGGSAGDRALAPGRRGAAADPRPPALARAPRGRARSRRALGLPSRRYAPRAGQRRGPGEAARLRRDGRRRPVAGHPRNGRATMTSEAGFGAPRRGVPRAIYMSVLAAVLWASAGGAALAQVPDNRDLKLDPEDRVPPFYRGTLDERDRQRFDAAREAGETYLPTFQGPFSTPGDTRAGDGSAVATGPTAPRTAYEGYRQPAREHPSEREPSRAGDFVGVLIEAWTRPARDRAHALARGGRPQSRRRREQGCGP